jgi:LysM repeat protein
MDARTRRELTHYGAPAAFLLVVTIAVLLIKAGLSGHETATTMTQQLTGTTPTTTVATTKTTTTVAGGFYTIQPGDTLGAIAIREHTTVARLLQLNPGIDPNALHSGQRIRVG